MTPALQPILFSYDPDAEGVWVDAAPFRAHLTLLLAAGLTEPVVARLAGVSVRSVAHLAHGRRGRVMRRICGDTGRRLLRITVTEARSIRHRPVPVRASRYRLRAMTAAGWSVERLADDLGLAIPVLERVIGRGSATCSQLVALTVAAAYEQWETDQDLAGPHIAVA
ncbi:hypothetical protein GCM10022204_29470 [Microlunatus aurantiacus]|uniref:Helix-turn-helix domain-containing protein n=1 Tax=Microlunatus aurantiacus TaxID=446786 RepID=A0ABP7DSE9_9ACTN